VPCLQATADKPAGWTVISPKKLKKQLKAGGVIRSRLAVAGNLVLGPEVDAPLVLHNSCIQGSLRANGTTFSGVVDLTNTEIEQGAAFRDADFGRTVVLTGTIFDGPARFDSSEFQGVALAPSAQFRQGAVFSDASFDALADFTGSLFSPTAPSQFVSTQFDGPARFTSFFLGPVGFQDASFSDGADFHAAQFLNLAKFNGAESAGDIDAQTATFSHPVSFSHSGFAGTADFTDAVFDDTLNLEEASIHMLNLDAHVLPSRIFLAGTGIDALQMNPLAVSRIQLPPGSRSQEEKERSTTANQGSATTPGRCHTRICLYGLVESEARQNNDLATANEAHILRWGAERGSWPPVASQVNWALGWEVGGYLVSPLHPATAILTLFVIGILLRTVGRVLGRSSLARSLVPKQSRKVHRPIGVWQAIKRASEAFYQINPGSSSPLFRAESALYKVLIAVLLINIEAVSPSIRDLVEGIL